MNRVFYTDVQKRERNIESIGRNRREALSGHETHIEQRYELFQTVCGQRRSDTNGQMMLQWFPKRTRAKL